MKNKVLILVMSLVLILGVLGTSYSYLKAEKYNSNGIDVTLSEMQVVLLTDMTAVTLQNNEPVEDIEGIILPDFGAKIRRFRLSNDGKYVALQLEGADGNAYYTVISSDGQKLYDPVTTDRFRFWGVCDGYIIGQDGGGITPDGKVFQLGDGTALSGIGENSLLYFQDSSRDDGEFILSDGYIVCKSKLYQSDGTEVTTVTAVN